MANKGFGAKVRLTVDQSNTARESFNKEIQALVDKIDISKNLTVTSEGVSNFINSLEQKLEGKKISTNVTVKKINVKGAISDVKQELEAMLKALSVSNGINISGIKDFISIDDIKAQKEALKIFENQATIFKTIEASLNKAYQAAISGNKMILDEAELNAIRQRYNDWLRQIGEIRAQQRALSEEELDALTAEGVAIQQKITQIQNVQAALEREKGTAKEVSVEWEAQAHALKAVAQGLDNAYKNSLQGKGMIEDVDKLNEFTNRYNAWIEEYTAFLRNKDAYDKKDAEAFVQRAINLQREITLLKEEETQRRKLVEEAKRKAEADAKADNAVASNRQVLEFQKSLNKYLAENTNLSAAAKTSLKNMLNTISENSTLPKKKLEELRTEFTRIKKEAEETGSTGKNMMSVLGKAFQTFGGAALLVEGVQKLKSLSREMVKNVIALDAAMTELKKVTNETDAAYGQFLNRAADRAKTLGATLTDTVSATADFARLGLSIDAASALADAALTYKNVGDGIKDIDTASESIISTMQAFGIEAEDAMRIVDRFNSVGNNFAISSSGIGDALVRSASALAAANNTLDESIGLITAANSVVQDADKVGTTMKTLSMYLRASKVEAEEAGISTEGMANSVSKLRESILTLTQGNVDIMLDANNYKSTYQILKEIANVWDNISDIDQASLLELIGGKRNANITAAIIENFATAEDAVATAANSVGSAVEENEKYLESITGKLNQFRSSFEALSEAVINTDLFGALIDGGTGFLNLLTSLTEEFGALVTFVPTITALVPVMRSLQGKTTPFLFGVGQDDTIKFGDLNFEQNFKAAGGSAESWSSFFKGIKAGFSDYSGILSDVSEDLNIFTSITDDSKITHKEFIDNIRSSKPVFADYLSSVDSKKATLKGFEQYLASTGRSVKDLSKEMGVATSIGGSFVRALGSMALDFGISLVVSFAISKIIEGIDQLVHAVEIQEAKLEEVRKEYENISAEANDVNEEIATTNTRINELQGKTNLTFVEEEELERLREINKELKIQKNLLETEKREAAGEVLNESIKTHQKKYGETEYSQEAVNEYLNTRQEAGLIGLEKDINAQIAARELLIKQIDEYTNKLATSNKEDRVFIKEDLELAQEALKNSDSYLNEYITDLLSYKKDFDEFISQYGVESLSDIQLDYYNNLKTNIERVYEILDPEGWAKIQTESFNNIWKNADFESVTKDLQKLAQTGKLTADTLNDTKYDAFMEAMEAAGFTAEEVFNQIMAMAGKQVPMPTVDSAPLTESISTASDAVTAELERLKSGFDLAETAQKEMDETGSISTDTLNKLKVASSDYTSCLVEEGGAVRLLVDDWKELLKVQAQHKVDELKASIRELEAEKSKLEAQRNQYTINEDTGFIMKDGEIVNAQNQIDALNAKIAELEQKLIEAGYAANVAEDDLRAITKATAEAIDFTNELNNAISNLGKVADAYKSVKSAIEEFNEQGAISISTFQNLYDNNYLQYLDNVDGKLQINAERLEAAALAQEKEMVASIRKQAAMDLECIMYGKVENLSETAKTALQEYETQTINAGNASAEAAKNNYIYSVSFQDLIDSMSGNAIANGFEPGEFEAMAQKVGNAWNKVAKTLRDSITIESFDTSKKSSTSKAAEKVKTEVELMQEVLEASLGDMEHQIFLWEQKGGMSEAIINMYRKMQDAVHEQAEAFRAMGMAETDDNIASLQKQWWEYENAIKDIIQSDFDDWVSDKKFAVEVLEADGASEQEIIRSWREILDRIKEEIERYENLGFDADSDIIQSLTDAAREAEDAIKDTLDSILDKAHEAVDSMQQINSTLINAAKEYAETGNITVDTLQSIIEMGVEYLAFLREENGLLVINEEKIRSITAARTEQLAVEAALNYVTQLKAALSEDNVYELNRLLNATVETTGATWNLVYANLALLDLNSQQFNAALQNINNLRALTQSAITSIQQTSNEANESLKETFEEIDYDSQLEYYENAQDALDEILDLTMDLIKYENEKQIEALEDQIDAYKKIIQLKKDSLDLDRKENDYNKNVSKKIEEIAELQAEINQLDLDDSREAQAQKAKLMEELAEKQEDLAQYQADYSYDVQVEMLDKELEAYEKEKEEEIEILEDAVSSTEKIYQQAIDRISNDWDGLYSDLMEWNYEYGSTLQSELQDAWQSASQAVQQYGGYLEAVKQVQQEIANIQIAQKQQEELKQQQQSNSIITSPSGNTVIGDSSGLGGFNAEGNAIGAQAQGLKQQMIENSMAWYTATSQSERDYYAELNKSLRHQVESMTGQKMEIKRGYWYLGDDTKPFYEISKDETARRVVAIMRANANAWKTADASTQKSLENKNNELAQNLATLLGTPIVKDKGVWYIGSIGGQQLFQKYHTGGIVGGGTIKENEQLALLEKQEAVLTEEQKAGLTKIMDFGEWVKQRFGTTLDDINRVLSGGLQPIKSKINSASVQEALSKVENHTNLNIDVRVEAPISVSGNLDERVVANLTNDISDRTIQRINEAFRLNGFTKFTKASMRP